MPYGALEEENMYLLIKKYSRFFVIFPIFCADHSVGLLGNT
jgi:hypothetical protein